jgi:hypothetical protein
VGNRFLEVCGISTQRDLILDIDSYRLRLFIIMMIQIFVCMSLVLHICHAEASIRFPSRFPYYDGWLGADAAYSIALNDSTVLWLFGDTFWNDLPEPTRNFSHYFISNSIALTTLRGSIAYDDDDDNNGILSPSIKFEYFRGSNWEKYTPNSFFTIPDTLFGIDASVRDKIRVWPKDTIIFRNTLWIAILIVEEVGGFFKSRGVDYISVENYLDPIDTWRQEWHTFMRSQRLFPATALTLVEQGEGDDFHVYALCTLQLDASGAELVNTMIRHVLPNASQSMADIDNLEYLPANKVGGLWSPLLIDSDTRDIVDANTVFEDMDYLIEKGATEASLHYDSDTQKWISIFSDEIGENSAIAMSTASDITGPYSNVTHMYIYPETDPQSIHYINQTFCYAGKSSAPYSKNGKLLLTYCCNSFNSDVLLSNKDIYVPRVVEFEL